MRENPVFRHAGRLDRRWWAVGALGALFATALAGLAIERYWMAMPEYSPLTPPRPARTLAIALLGETLVLLPWAALRVAALWRRLRLGGQIEEYRRSRLSPAAIAGGALLAGLSPVLAACALSLAVYSLVALCTELRLAEVLAAHGLLVAQVAGYGALGLWLAARLRHPGLALPLALAGLAIAVGALWVVDAVVPRLPDPYPWIYAALLPNPVTAVGNALNTDVLRFAWLYERLRIPEYFYVYPPVWQTAGLYLSVAGFAFAGACRRVGSDY